MAVIPRPRLHGLAGACAVAAVLAGATPAMASRTQETILQDDPQIVYHSSPEQLDRTLRRVKALGVDRIRVSVFWHLVAPKEESLSKPWEPGGGRNPANYPAEKWQRYDDIVKLSRKHGLGVLMTLTGPIPAWGHTTRRRQATYNRPSPSEFRDLAVAVGARYSGAYPDDDVPAYQAPPPREPEPTVPGEVATTEEQPPPPPPPPPLPRVDHWSIWNEPNFPTWLSPQRTRFGRRGIVPASPRLYRELVDAGYSGLAATGHANDTILIGETAPRGGAALSKDINKTMLPLPFLRELYCLGANYRPYRGRAARRRGCPRNRSARRRFVAAHPGLFATSGWAHHPYSLDRRPTWKYPHKDAVTLGSLRHMTRVLDRSLGAWRVRRRLPLYMTEYGYQTRPPSPFGGVSPARQAAWTSWAEEVAFRNRRVAAFAQFLLVDDRPHQVYKGKLRWVTWQSGLLDWDLNEKPAFDEFARPIRVAPTRVRRRGRVRVFGALRPPEAGAVIPARVEHRRGGGGWRTLRSLSVRNPRGYLSAVVRVPASGALRIRWTDPVSGEITHSRAVGVRTRG